MINPTQLITCNFYENLVKEINSSSIVHVPTEQIADFFAKTPDDTKLTVVSAMSDYSIRFQDSNHPNQDLIKHASAMDWGKISGINDRYITVQIGPTCGKTKCNLNDLYSIKIDRHTIATFTRIPRGVRWYCANLDITHHQANWIPFGIDCHGNCKDILSKYRGRKKKGLVYVNFQDNSFDRVHIKNHFRRQPWATFRENFPYNALPLEQYLEELSEHQFVISPFGNGLDCFRTYEALYLGVVPIVPTSFLANHMRMANLPVYSCSDYFSLSESDLHSFSCSPTDFYNEILTKKYWEEKIRG